MEISRLLPYSQASKSIYPSGLRKNQLSMTDNVDLAGLKSSEELSALLELSAQQPVMVC